MSDHYIIICQECDCTISQCRCLCESKTVRYEICANCQTKEKPESVSLELNKKELQLIIKWYHNGWTELSVDTPLFTKITQLYQRVK